MKVFQLLAFVYIICSTAFSVQAVAVDHKNVLMVVSSYGEKNQEGELIKPGFEFDELTKAYAVFNHANLNIDIASPNGGAVVADRYDPKKSYNQLFLNDKSAMRRLENTMPLSQVDASRYSAVFVVGGKGPMFDLHQNSQLQTIIRQVYEQEGVVSAVCHGPAALVDIRLSNGEYLVSGKRINSFTNDEESAFGKKWTKQFAFMLEDKLRERGALFENSDIMLSHVAIDERVITGQNPFSTVDTALAVVRSLGIAPAEFTAFKDDATMKLVAKIIVGDTAAEQEFAQNITAYQAELAAMYGYYRFKLAKTETEIASAVTLMRLTHKTLNAAPLDLALAQGLLRLRRNDEAKNVLSALLQREPDSEEAKALLEQTNAQ